MDNIFCLNYIMKEFDLHKNKIQTGFKTPPSFLDGFEDVVMAKLNIQEHKPVKKLWQQGSFWFNSVAAAAVLVVGGIYYSNHQAYKNLDHAIIENYILTTSSTEDLSSKLSENDIEELSIKIIKKEDIEDYVNLDLGYHWED